MESTMRVVLSAILFVLSACGQPPDAIKAGNPADPATAQEHIDFFIDTQAVKREYLVLGYVSAERTARTAGESVEDAELIAEMKRQASRLGADGIILESLFTDSDSSLVSGFKDTLERKRARALAIRLR
jgi:hypothetical protein